jgi:predicted nucleic-acid-binding protein
LKIIADTNVLVRATLKDHADQAEAARRLLLSAQSVAIPLSAFCEFAWVLGGGYRYSNTQIGFAIAQYLKTSIVVTDREAVEAGLAFLDQGGDFADGVMAHEGRRLGGEYFASFDRKALRLLAQQGHKTVEPA